MLIKICECIDRLSKTDGRRMIKAPMVAEGHHVLKTVARTATERTARSLRNVNELQTVQVATAI